MASQIERERMAESTARYHAREADRWFSVWLDTASDEPNVNEIGRRATHHYREAEAAEVREIAIQLEDFDVRDLLALRRPSYQDHLARVLRTEMAKMGLKTKSEAEAMLALRRAA